MAAAANEIGFDDIKTIVDQRKNIFLTGPGGVGKSYYVKRLKELYGDRVSITSTTGVSSFNLCGRTIHSFSGIGALKQHETIEAVMKRIKKNPTNAERWRTVDILVIDEVSMMGKRMLEFLDLVARHFRNAHLPFGGIQLLLTGDFLQLPPIDDDFAFCSDVWNSLDLHVIYLTKMYRVADPVFTAVLERIRVGKPLPADNVLLFKRQEAYRKLDLEDEKENPLLKIRPTFLYSRKVDVFSKNMEELDKNPNEEMRFPPIFYTSEKRRSVMRFDKQDVLILKVGAQVMLTVNHDVESGLVNGSRGVVLGYHADTETLRVRFLDNREINFERFQYTVEEDGTVQYYVNQFPFILAYALSIHKVQGCTLDFAVMDLGHSVFEDSMSYVALSRVRSLEGLFLTAYQPHRVKCNEKALAFYENLSK